MSAADEASRLAWRLISTDRARNHHEVHVTDLAKCLRQIHYRANQTPFSDPDIAGRRQTMMAAHMGTAIDDHYTPAYARAWPMTDKRIIWCQPHVDLTTVIDGVTIHGTADVIAQTTDSVLVWDLKTVSASKFEAVWAGEIPIEHLAQIYVYAHLAELKYGKTAQKVVLYYVCRSDPEAYKDYQRSHRYRTLEIPYNDTHRASAKAQLTGAVKAATSTRHATRWFANGGKISGLYSPCRSCPWQRRCLGKALEDAETRVPEEVAADALRGLTDIQQLSRDAAKALNEFFTLHHAKTTADKSKKNLRELVDDLGLDKGTYTDRDGNQYEVRVTGTNTMITDESKLAELAEKHGLTVPKKSKAPTVTVRRISDSR